MGDFTCWDKYPISLDTCEDGYEATVMLLKGVYEYKYRVDGKWASDPVNPYRSAYYGNSLLYIDVNPTVWRCDHWKMPPTQYVRPDCNFWYFQEVETGLNTELSKAGMRKRPLYVLLPPSYGPDSAPIPVVYAIDGYDSFSNGKQGRYLDQFLDSKWAQHSLPEFIFVAIPSLAVSFPGFEKKDLFIKDFSDIENETYLKFLLEIVVPTIKSRYNLSLNPAHSVIMGDHHGGLVSFIASLLYPNTFGQAVSISPSFGYHDCNNTTIFDFMRRIKPPLSSFFYLDSSNLPGDNKHTTQAMANYLSTCSCMIPEGNYLYENLHFEPLKHNSRQPNSDWQMRLGKALEYSFN